LTYTETPDREVERPRWAGRVPRHKIARLYATDAVGIVDEEQIDDVGYALLARCESMVLAVEAQDGKALCPKCGDIVYHSAKSDTVKCSECGWELPWQDYVRSSRRKQLHPGGIAPFIAEYLEQFPKANTPRKKMIQIDNLIHRYHWELQGDPGRPSAVNLIGGKIPDVIEFLDDLTYSEKSTPGLAQNYARWRKRGRKLIRRLEREKKRGMPKAGVGGQQAE
jgi:predicted RNA-binding Zn-ribbon protein involved in translation (DUF1610 family)